MSKPELCGPQSSRNSNTAPDLRAHLGRPPIYLQPTSPRAAPPSPSQRGASPDVCAGALRLTNSPGAQSAQEGPERGSNRARPILDHEANGAGRPLAERGGPSSESICLGCRSVQGGNSSQGWWCCPAENCAGATGEAIDAAKEGAPQHDEHGGPASILVEPLGILSPHDGGAPFSALYLACTRSSQRAQQGTKPSGALVDDGRR